MTASDASGGSALPAESAGSVWRSVGERSVTARVRGEILRVMQERRLRPGDRLPAERELAALLQVSRPSVRESVRSLEAEGRLEVRHGAGVFVAEPSDQRRLRAGIEPTTKITHLYDMREVLEVPAARWAAERLAPDAREQNPEAQAALARVREALEALDAYVQEWGENADLRELQTRDLEFHARITEAAGNELLIQTQAVIYDIVLEGMRSTLLMPGRLEGAHHEHAAILDAIERGAAEAASTAARNHVRGARAAALDRLAQQLEGTASSEQLDSPASSA